MIFGKIIEDPQRSWQDLQRILKDLWRSLKILPRSSKILARKLRILKDLGKDPWGSSKIFALGSSKIFMKIFKDLWRSLKDFHQGMQLSSHNYHILVLTLKAWVLSLTYFISEGAYYHNWLYTIYLGKQVWHSGESACLPPMCPRFDSWTQRHKTLVGWVCWFSTLLWEDYLQILWFSPLPKH